MADRDPAALADKSLPRFWRMVVRSWGVRVSNSAVAVAHGQLRAAVGAVRPSMICVCQGYEACKPYYLHGYYAFCPNCGTYAPC